MAGRVEPSQKGWQGGKKAAHENRGEGQRAGRKHANKKKEKAKRQKRKGGGESPLTTPGFRRIKGLEPVNQVGQVGFQEGYLIGSL
jgi:hypothetical protein